MAPQGLAALVLLAAYGWSMWATRGEYAAGPILATFSLFCLLCVLHLAYAESPRPAPATQVERALTGLFLLFFTLVMIHPQIGVFTSFAAKCILQGWLWLGLAGFGLFALKQTENLGFWTAAVTLSLALYWVSLVDPSPNIDVWVFYRQACRSFLTGHNPYPEAYPDIYNGAYAYPPGLHYLPAALYWLTPFQFLFGEIRVGLWVAKIGSAGLLAALAGSLGLSRRAQRLAALVWLVFPTGFRVLEFSWMDTLLGFWTLGALVLWVRGRPKGAAACLAMALCTKQTGIFIAFITLAFFAFNPSRRREGLRCWTLAVLGALAMMLPFMLADWHAYWTSVTEFWSEPVRLDSFTLVVLAINGYGLRVDLWQTLVIYSFLVPIVMWRLGRSSAWQCWCGGVVTLLGFVFYFGKQAFCNYYDLLSLFLMAYLLLCWGLEPGGTGFAPSDPEPTPPTP